MADGAWGVSLQETTRERLVERGPFGGAGPTRGAGRGLALIRRG